METDALILARDKDIDIVQKATTNAEQQFQDISGRSISTKVQGGLSKDLCVLRECVYSVFIPT
jgi:hypothetical protein